MARPKAILTLTAAEFPRRGRGATGKITVQVLGKVTTTDDGRMMIDTAALSAASVAELAALCGRLGLDPGQTFAEGINLMQIKREMAKHRVTKPTSQKDILAQVEAAQLGENAKQIAREMVRLGRMMKIDPSVLLGKLKQEAS